MQEKGAFHPLTAFVEGFQAAERHTAKVRRERENADEQFSKLKDENDSLRSRVKELELMALEILGAQSCPYCPNAGYYSHEEYDGEEEQVECEWCGTTPNSIYQVKTRIRAALKEKLR
jgi:hypothetical protein